MILNPFPRGPRKHQRFSNYLLLAVLVCNLPGCGSPVQSESAFIKYSTFSPNSNYVEVVLEIYSKRGDDIVLRELLAEAFEKYPKGFFQHDGTDIEKINVRWRGKTIELSQGMLPVIEGVELSSERAFFEKLRKEISNLSSTRVRD